MPTLKNGTEIPLSNGSSSVRVVSFIDEGGQGEVYRVVMNGEEYALKWYSKITPSDGFYRNLFHFRPFLNQYLRSLGYRQIVYYSGAKNVGKFVLDDESAILAINKNKHLQQPTQQENSAPPSQPSAESAPTTTGRRKRRILNPSAAAAQTPPEGQSSSVPDGNSQESQNTQNTQNAQNTQNTPATQPGENERGSKPKLVYKQPKITPAAIWNSTSPICSAP